MASFTTRPEIAGTFGVVASTHWIASTVGMGVLEKGGNAFDAAVSMGFVLQVVEPHLNGPAGEVPAVFYSAAQDKVQVLCGQGTAPAGATIQAYRDEGLSLIPGSGLLATVIPGAFDAWMLLLRDHGTISIRDALEPAISYAQNGHPLLERVALSIGTLSDLFTKEWTSSADTWMPGGNIPKKNDLFCNPVLANTWMRLLREAESVSGREAQIEKARDVFYRGFVAETIGDYMKDACVMDGTGARRKGVLTADDMASWSATFEQPLTSEFGDWTLCKTGPWGQGPVTLQVLEILKHTSIADMPVGSVSFVHTLIEAIKLVFADREAYYGDPLTSDIPMEHLLSESYAKERAGLITDTASHETRPGRVPGLDAWAEAAIQRAAQDIDVPVGADAGEPTMAKLANRQGRYGAYRCH